MKGQMADAGYLFYSKMQQYMFPGTTYAHNSGGDPANITDLTHAELVNFHKTHYHPSNARFYTYGNFPLEESLETINSKLQEFSPITPPLAEKIVKPFESPRRVNLTCPVDPSKHLSRPRAWLIPFCHTEDSISIICVYCN
jgi:Zn-dependent M16 (insulinase) family peptidase